ncbi:Dirigent protein 23 [Camellia lanceoleosa]|uniref:Dirigent protein 23 n=1 Tax=Camellia lanceoleosa TaxID=1840588 RepID=A0ACC0I880_9ERIC|nr:Dirigent protein 23 [Camellia lanceoleosa]
MALNYGFVDGIYNGSSISIVGLNYILHSVREMAVVGGTGLFRLARGYAVAKTHWFDPISGDAIVGYNVTIVLIKCFGERITKFNTIFEYLLCEIL